MGFGYGGSQARSGIKRYNNSQLAHVWNAQTERQGQTNNGNAYFNGAELYSYGSHFLTGYIMPDGVALLNGDSYSVTTSGHQSDARSAVSDRATFTIAKLTELRDLLNAISRGKLDSQWKRRARDVIRTHAEALAASRRYDSGVSDDYEWLDSPDPETGRTYRVTSRGGESAGAYLTRVSGLPAASWPKLEREAAALKAKREKARAKELRESAISKAIHLADASDSQFREAIRAKLARTYAAESDLGSMALDFHRAKKTAKAEGFSKRRLDSLRAREKRIRALIPEAESRARLVKARDATAGAIKSFRHDVKVIRDHAGPCDWAIANRVQQLARTAAILAESTRLSVAARRRMALIAGKAAEAGDALQASYAKAEAERREAERKARELAAADYQRAWLAGEVPFARHFDAPSGGAALRIKDNRLETSHGADVPLAEAVRAFRFIKLCREAGREWHANGQQVRVGAFRLDWINAAGDMKAGCHNFTWPEIERAARLAGVANDPASAEAVREKESINA
jgi:hypothetical protein